MLFWSAQSITLQQAACRAEEVFLKQSFLYTHVTLSLLANYKTRACSKVNHSIVGERQNKLCLYSGESLFCPRRTCKQELHLRKPQDSCNQVLWTRGQQRETPPWTSGLITCQARSRLCFSQSQDAGPHSALIPTVGVRPEHQTDKWSWICALCVSALNVCSRNWWKLCWDAHTNETVGDPVFLKTSPVYKMSVMLKAEGRCPRRLRTHVCHVCSLWTCFHLWRAKGASGDSANLGVL